MSTIANVISSGDKFHSRKSRSKGTSVATDIRNGSRRIQITEEPPT